MDAEVEMDGSDVPPAHRSQVMDLLRNLPSVNKKNFSNCKRGCQSTGNRVSPYIGLSQSPAACMIQTDNNAFLLGSLRAASAVESTKPVKRKHEPENPESSQKKHRQSPNTSGSAC